MVRKSYGKMRGTRTKLSGKYTTISKFLDRFEAGETVRINFVSHRIPHPKFQGLTGKVIGKRGQSYIVEVRDRDATKNICLRPEHLKR